MLPFHFFKRFTTFAGALSVVHNSILLSAIIHVFWYNTTMFVLVCFLTTHPTMITY